MWSLFLFIAMTSEDRSVFKCTFVKNFLFTQNKISYHKGIVSSHLITFYRAFLSWKRVRVPRGARARRHFWINLIRLLPLYTMGSPSYIPWRTAPSRFVASRLIGIKAKEERVRRAEGKNAMLRIGAGRKDDEFFLQLAEPLIAYST